LADKKFSLSMAGVRDSVYRFAQMAKAMHSKLDTHEASTAAMQLAMKAIEFLQILTEAD
jgi:hypothetical protein